MKTKILTTRINPGDTLKVTRNGQGLGLLLKDGDYAVLSKRSTSLWLSGSAGLPVNLNLAEGIRQGMEFELKRKE